ncbi:MAG: HIT family protein [Mycobacteriaceae bacterium]|nr:HIT family protein [Mycobacteriaceae bacterium]
MRWSDHDRGEYLRTVRTGPCFICEIVSGRSEYRHHEVYRDEYHIVFLNRYPTLYGQLLVAPTAHREDIIEDFTEFEYLRLQGLVHRVSRAVALVVPTERVYIFSLGSKQGNAHVHWHLAPLPPGVPYDDQQLAAIDLETHGQLVIPETDQADLADRVSQALNKRSPS